MGSVANEHAQTDPDLFAATGHEPIPAGGVLAVRFVDPARAGQTIAVTARDGDDPTATARLDIRLRGNGKGEELFIVPVGWASVVLEAPGSAVHVVDVALPP